MRIDPAKAVVAAAKLADYILSVTHPIGRYKSTFFLGLGYRPDKPELLAADLISLLETSAEPGPITEYGQKVLAKGEISGPNGQSGRIQSVWIILSGESLIRFVTAYPES